MNAPQDATLDALLDDFSDAVAEREGPCAIERRKARPEAQVCRAKIVAHFAASAQTAVGECAHEWQTTGGGSGEARRSLACAKCGKHRDTLMPPAQQPAAPETIELSGIEPDDGFWESCTGCHECNEGVPTGQWSALFGCYMGGGCSECGGIGVKWDNTDYAKFVDEPVPCPTAGCVYVAGHLCACRTEPTECVAQAAPPPAAQTDGDALAIDEAAWALAKQAEDAGAARDSDDDATWWTLSIEHFKAIAALRQQSPANRPEVETVGDGFNGSDERLVECANALISLDASGSLVPHGIGGHARTLLQAFIARWPANRTGTNCYAPRNQSLRLTRIFRHDRADE